MNLVPGPESIKLARPHVVDLPPSPIENDFQFLYTAPSRMSSPFSLSFGLGVRGSHFGTSKECLSVCGDPWNGLTFVRLK